MQILGTHKPEKPAGTVGHCLQGNPVKVADYQSLQDTFEYLYFVKIFYHLGYRFFKVLGPVQKGGETK